MEIVKYQEAIQYYEMAYKLEPHRIEGVDYYSSCLWHLKKHVELTNLAHQSLQKTLYAP
jgi:anaphase-promoting complex subunit 3